MKQFLEIAKITKTQGLKGELRAVYYCDDPYEIEEFGKLYFEGGKQEIELENFRVQKNIVILKLKGVNDVEAAQQYINKILYIDRNDVELPEDVWFIQDIIGSRVIDADDSCEYGIVTEILQNAPTDVYVLAGKNGKELLFPAIPEVLLSVDTDKKEIVIRPLEGLFDGEEIKFED